MDTISLTDDQDKLKFATNLFTGRAMTWWRHHVLCNASPISTWSQLTSALLAEFTDVDRENKLRNKLAALKQTQSVSKYISTFRDTVVELGPAAPDEQALIHQFIKGLKYQVQVQVALQQPTQLADAFQIAERADGILFYV